MLTCRSSIPHFALGFVLVVAGCGADDETEDDRLPTPAQQAAQRPAPPPPPPAPSTTTQAPPAVAQPDPFALSVTNPSTPPVLTATQRHQAKGVNPQNPTRQSCIGAQCHVGRSKPFLFAVTICTTDRCNAFAPNAEVRIATGDGKVYQAFTGADGNAWFAGEGTLAAPAWVAIRGGTKVATKKMHDPLFDAQNAGSCNMQGCHGVDIAGSAIKNTMLFLP